MKRNSSHLSPCPRESENADLSYWPRSANKPNNREQFQYILKNLMFTINNIDNYGQFIVIRG